MNDKHFIRHRWSYVLAGLSIAALPGGALANCVTSGLTTLCDTNTPNPYTQRIGTGPNNAAGATVTLNPNAHIAVGNLNAISLGNNATITLGAGSSVTNNATSSTGSNGLWGGGPNTIEFGSNGTLTIGVGATVAATGTQNNGEPINVFGSNNTIINYGTINSKSGAAIWFEDKTITAGTTNTVDNHGTIITQLGSNANVIGNNSNGPVTFINRTGAVVQGSLSFAGGDDNLKLEAGSVITGSFNGGGGNNTLTLSGATGSSDSLAGDIRNFQTLNKNGLGVWTLTGAVGANTGSNPIPLSVFVNDGTLALTGNNANFNGTITVGPGTIAGTGPAVLEARAQSLPPSIIDNGLVRFVQDTAGTYTGVISGSGAVEKTLGGTLTLAGVNTYSGGTTVNAGTLSISADNNLGAASGGLTLNSGTLNTTASFAMSRAATLLTAGGTFNTNAGTALTYNGVIGGDGDLIKTGAGTLILNNANTYFGSAILQQGVLQIASDSALSSMFSGLLFSGGTLSTTADITTYRLASIDANGGTIDTAAGTTFTDNGSINGVGTLTKIGSGTLDLSGSILGATQAGGMAINGGTVKISSDAQLGALAAGLSFNGGTLEMANGITVDRATTLNAGGGTIAVDQGPNVANFDGVISGAGGLTKTGGGVLFLHGDNTYTGATTVASGWLYVDGDQSAATGTTTVASGARLDGNGTLGGDVILESGSVIGPGSVVNSAATLTINGSLTIDSGAELLYNMVQANTAGGALNDLLVVNGDLTLGGTINVVDQGQTLGPGVYRIINYSGTLTNNGLTIGNFVTPPNTPQDPTVITRPITDLTVQTAIPNQVNLINTQGLALTYWDGGNAANWSNNVINGGNSLTNPWSLNPAANWTNADGSINATWSNAGFAIFIGASGNVVIDDGAGQITASGMQFGVDGYTLTGQPLTLVDDGSGSSTVRVGDGTSAGASMTATISAELNGTTQLRKTDSGTLILDAANTYTGGTRIEGGTVQIAADTNLGAAGSGLWLDNNGTLQTTASINTDRAVELGANGGTFNTDAGTVLTLTSTVTDETAQPGALTKIGNGTLLLTGNGNTWSGLTTISGGTLQIGDGVTGTGSIGSGDIVDNGMLSINGISNLTLGNFISGSGALGVLNSNVTLTNNNTYTGGTTISTGSTLHLGNGGTSGSIVGDVVDNGTLDFNRSDSVTFSGVISGTGAVTQSGSGITTLTGNNSYTGTTTVASGWLYVDGDQSAATGATTVASGARLGGSGIVGGSVTMASGSSITPGAIPNTPSTLTINGDLTLNSGTELLYNMVQANVVGGALNDLLVVNGNLTLDGTINVIDQGQILGPGVYRIINYSGTLTDNGLDIGNFVTPPATPQDSEVITRPLTGFSVQTVIPNQVNLVNSAGLTMNYWDVTGKNDNLIAGGTGIWQNGGALDNWTDSSGSANASWTPQGFAIFSGTAGTVTVDDVTNGAVVSQGMQFTTGTAATPYLITGGDLTLENSALNDPMLGPAIYIRVGDGTAGSTVTAEIDSNLVAGANGAATLAVTDGGTLILKGNNQLSVIGVFQGSTLQTDNANSIATNFNLIALADGSTLHTTASLTDNNNIGIAAAFTGTAAGTIEVDGGTTLTLNGQIADVPGTPGSLTKAGGGQLILTNVGSLQGTTTIAGGTLQFGSGGTSGVLHSAGGVSIASGATV
ncbi:MAG: autotransporter-associated beta strand repeat-containing protein, partial [Xanthomonadaceae bacterium]|nr:autotransporter-associated beta strand repeat-containing protein [Xanthomonadaceae bacterium]